MPLLVGDHHHGLVKVLVEFPDQFKDDRRVPGIEVGTRLIGKEDGGVVDECTGNGNPLLLSPGHFSRAEN